MRSVGCYGVCIGWVVLGSAVIRPAAATEPVARVSATPNRVAALKIQWVEKRKQQHLREQLLRIDRLKPHWQSLANALWRDSSQNGFSLDVDPGDDEVMLKYRVRF
jgi:hypothetical protein